MILLFIIYPMIIFLVLFIIGIVFLILHLVDISEKNNKINQKQLIVNKDTNTINKEYSKYTTNYYLLTFNELQFYRKLKNYITENNLYYEIFPQVDLERMIKVIDNNVADRNKIKSRSIDFTIVSKQDCKIVCCIELDDYSHQRKDRIQRDIFINGLFKKVNIKLFRITIKNNYSNDFNNIFHLKKDA